MTQTNPKDPQADIREAIRKLVWRVTETDHQEQWLTDELTALFQAREQQLITEILGAAVEVNTVQYSYVNGDKMIAGFTNSAVPVSVIKRLQNKTNDGGSNGGL